MEEHECLQEICRNCFRKRYGEEELKFIDKVEEAGKKVSEKYRRRGIVFYYSIGENESVYDGTVSIEFKKGYRVDEKLVEKIIEEVLEMVNKV